MITVDYNSLRFPVFTGMYVFEIHKTIKRQIEWERRERVTGCLFHVS